MAYGLPAAGFLARALSRPLHLQPSYHVLPRAEVIRHLAVFTANLGWVTQPGDGNYDACSSARVILTSVLDKVLEQGFGGSGSGGGAAIATGSLVVVDGGVSAQESGDTDGVGAEEEAMAEFAVDGAQEVMPDDVTVTSEDFERLIAGLSWDLDSNAWTFG